LSGIGAKGADNILELREAKGDLELDDLNQVPYLRITPQLIECLDFTSFENKELEKGEVVSYAGDMEPDLDHQAPDHLLLLLILKYYRPPLPLSLTKIKKHKKTWLFILLVCCTCISIEQVVILQNKIVTNFDKYLSGF
jgi:hypothetical protein